MNSPNHTRGIPTAAGSTDQHQLPAATPRIIVEVEPCDHCSRVYALNLLTQVLGEGLLCIGCVERVREELAS